MEYTFTMTVNTETITIGGRVTYTKVRDASGTDLGLIVHTDDGFKVVSDTLSGPHDGDRARDRFSDLRSAVQAVLFRCIPAATGR
jgi:hypothetical protein